LQNRLSSVLKKKLKTKNHTQSDFQVPNLRSKRSTVKNEDSKLKSTFSTIRNIRRAANLSVEINKNSLVKKNNAIPSSITITRSNSKATANGKKNTKVVTLNKTSIRSTRSSTPTKIIAK
jgi:hypothetical protein